MKPTYSIVPKQTKYQVVPYLQCELLKHLLDWCIAGMRALPRSSDTLTSAMNGCLIRCDRPTQDRFQGNKGWLPPPVRILAPEAPAVTPNEVHVNWTCIYITPQIYIIYRAQKSPKLI